MSLPQTVSTSAATFVLRRATADDVPEIVNLLADDPLGAARELPPGSDLAPYHQSFQSISADPAQLLLVATDDDGAVVGTMQLTFIPGMARQGSLRGQIEAVRVRNDCRRLGLGRAMFAWAVDEARRRHCALVQLTTDKQRTDAHRFYADFGFVNSHEGLKLVL